MKNEVVATWREVLLIGAIMGFGTLIATWLQENSPETCVETPTHPASGPDGPKPPSTLHDCETGDLIRVLHE